MNPKEIFTEKTLQEWIQLPYQSKKKRDELKKIFNNNTPFPHLELTKFFNEEKLKKIRKALAKEEFIEKEADLFKFMQTHDFATTIIPELKEFREFLASEICTSYIEEITATKIKMGGIDISASLYQNTDYLLPHDDQLEGRKIAFMIYLSTLKAKDGGKLILYKTKGSIPREEEKAIVPKFNKCVFFKVSEKSFHEVEELIVNKQRITIGGWFHDSKSSLSQTGKY